MCGRRKCVVAPCCYRVIEPVRPCRSFLAGASDSSTEGGTPAVLTLLQLLASEVVQSCKLARLSALQLLNCLLSSVGSLHIGDTCRRPPKPPAKPAAAKGNQTAAAKRSAEAAEGVPGAAAEPTPAAAPTGTSAGAGAAAAEAPADSAVASVGAEDNEAPGAATPGASGKLLPTFCMPSSLPCPCRSSLSREFSAIATPRLQCLRSGPVSHALGG